MAWTTPRTWVTGELVTAAYMNTHIRDNLLAVVPIGTVLPFAGSSAPNSLYLLCDGSAVSRTTYADLFALISTTYGAGDGVNTFNLPDMRGRVAVGRSAGGKSDVDTLGDSDGLAANLRNVSHRHSLTMGDSGTSTDGKPGKWNTLNSQTSSAGVSGDSDNIDRPAYLVLNYIVKALQS